MKTILSSTFYTAIFALSIGASYVANAQEPEKKNHSHSLHGFWKQLDTNQDEQISEDELNASPMKDKVEENIFETIDADQNGALSKEEIKAHMIKRHEEKKNRMEKLDTDKSGGVSIEEFKQGEFISKLSDDKIVKMFEKLDTNHDGQISPEDRPDSKCNADGKKPKITPEELFAKQDKDSSGNISFEEFTQGKHISQKSPEEQKKIFNMLDKNQDNQLTLDEMPKHKSK